MIQEPIDIALRPYVPAIESDTQEKEQIKSRLEEDYPILVFDTETNEDERQTLLFGSCGIWVSGYLHKFYIFYEENLPKKHVETLKRYAQTQKIDGNNIEVVSVRWFVENIFFPWITENHALCVGFNLPFDLSRIAIDSGYARDNWKGGFTFWLTEKEEYPRLKIRSLDSVISFFSLAPTKYSGAVRGRFLDLRALGFGLTDEKLNLKKACELLDTKNRKSTIEHFGTVAIESIEYNVNDTLATYDLYLKMVQRLRELKLEIPPEKIFSPASLGKAYLRQMGIRSFVSQNPDFPPEILGYIMTSFYGGRSEVKIRKKPVKVRLLDYRSMYPTLFALFGLWRYIIANKIEHYDSTEEVRRLVEKITLNSLTDQSLYRNLISMVQIQPDNDILPVRAIYGEDRNVHNIGINHVTSDTPLWYALPDVIASKLLTGKAPKILRAISFRPVDVQDALSSVEIPGGLTISPQEDFIKSLIEYRKQVRDRRDRCGKDTPEYLQLDTIQNQLKILANATAYGIFIEINTEDTPRRKIDTYGLNHTIRKSNKIEHFGPFFNPIMATMLTSGARLMLAIVEAWLREHNGYFAFCDTDSMAVSPRHWVQLQSFLQPLNPYNSTEPLLKLEYDERDESGNLPDLWFYGISAKRYVLYRMVKDKPVLVKDGWSSHGLGHLLHGNGDDPDVREKWETQLWTRIIETAKGKLSEAALSEEYAGEYAVSKFAVTKLNLHRRLKAINRGKGYSSQIKPYNFVLVGQPAESGKDEPIHPITKFTKNVEAAPFQSFIDYNTGRRYTQGTQLYWKPLSTVISEYIDHPETKFQNGHQSGTLKRRRLRVTKISYIGKEANVIEEAETFGACRDGQARYTETKSKAIL